MRWGVRVPPVPLVAVFRERPPCAQDPIQDRDMERTRLLRPVVQGSVPVARPPPPVDPPDPVRSRPREVLVRGALAVPVASWEEPVPVALVVRTIRRSRRVASTRPSALTMSGDELPEGYVNPMSQTYGSDKDLSPAPRKDDGWDPRQW